MYNIAAAFTQTNFRRLLNSNEGTGTLLTFGAFPLALKLRQVKLRINNLSNGNASI